MASVLSSTWFRSAIANVRGSLGKGSSPPPTHSADKSYKLGPLSLGLGLEVGWEAPAIPQNTSVVI